MAGQDVAEELAKEENIAFQIPEELLRDAGIPMDADLDIVLSLIHILHDPGKGIPHSGRTGGRA